MARKSLLDTVDEIAEKSSENAKVITVKMIDTKNIVDYPRNGEDVEDTGDLQESIRQLGFIDPIEVTDFGMPEGQFMIVSGHRRRMAGTKEGITKFPCIIKSFNSQEDIRNYVLLANSQRDSAKDPLLFCKRYKAHEEYLKEISFTGKIREEVAKRLGISVQQADRYNQFNKVILPVWEMVRTEVVGMSSVLPMASHPIEEQEEIHAILKECLEQGEKLTRDMCDKIIKGYREGKKTFLDIVQLSMEDIGIEKEPVHNPLSGVSVMHVNTEPSETGTDSEPNPLRTNEINYDFGHREGLDGALNEPTYSEERLNEEDMEVIRKAEERNKREKEEMDKVEKEKKQPLTEEEKTFLAGEKVSKALSNLEEALNEIYAFEDEEKAENVLRTMSQTAELLFAEMEGLADRIDTSPLKFYKDIEESLKEFIKSHK